MTIGKLLIMFIISIIIGCVSFQFNNLDVAMVAFVSGSLELFLMAISLKNKQ